MIKKWKRKGITIMRKFEDSLLEIVQLRGGYEILNNKQKTLEVYANLNPGSDKINWICEAFDCGAIPYMMNEVERGSANYVVIKKKIFKLLSECRSDAVRNRKMMICMFRAVGWDDTAEEVERTMKTGKKVIPLAIAAVMCVIVGCAFLFKEPIINWAEGVIGVYENRNTEEISQSQETKITSSNSSDQKNLTQQQINDQTKQQNITQEESQKEREEDVQQNLAVQSEQPIQLQDDTDMVSVSVLNWRNMGLFDTSGVRGYDNVSDLDVGENQITNLADLSVLTKLTVLNIYHNPVSDLSPLSNLKGLIRIDAGETPISDLAPLSSLYELTYLDVWYTNVSDLSPLSSLTSLTNLYLSHSLVTSLDPIVNLPNISVLSISGLNITDGSLERFKQKHPNCTIYSQSRSEELENPDAYLMPQSNVYALSKTFLRDYSTYDLWIAKNEIFARKGRKFKNAELQSYFNEKSWYHGVIESDDFDPDTMLNDAEKANVEAMIDLGADTYQK